VNPADVTAVIVTRGDVNLQPVLDSLIFDDVIVFDNSTRRIDQMTYGRVLAARRARNHYIYSQDDDITHTRDDQERIVAAYEPGMMAGCMWPEWSDGARRQGIQDGYDDLVFPGSGSITHLGMWEDAIDEYLDEWPEDDFFRLWCDTIIGVIVPTIQLDIRFTELPHADNKNRMSWLPDGVANKTEAIRRAREIRDAVPV